jgi:hypothetical protein
MDKYIKYLQNAAKGSDEHHDDCNMLIEEHFNIIQMASALSVPSVVPLPFFI